MAQIIDMPKLSDTMTVGTLVKWLKSEGSPVKSGDMLAEAFRERNLHTEDSLEGPKAFVEKRTPNWRCR